MIQEEYDMLTETIHWQTGKICYRNRIVVVDPEREEAAEEKN